MMSFPGVDKKCTSFLAMLVMLTALPFTMNSPAVMAAPAEQGENSRVRRTQALRPQIYSKLEEAQTLADSKRFAESLALLNNLKNRPLNAYEKAMTWNIQAYVHFNQEQYVEAVKAYEAVLAIQDIPQSLEESSLYSLARLHFVREDYPKALKALDQWFSITPKPNAQAYVMRAQIHYEVNNSARALSDIKQAMALARQQKNTIPEGWLLLERAVYFKNKDFASMERCMQDLIAHYPKKQYWIQLAAVYNELGKPLKEIAILETLHEKGELTTEQEITNLAQAFLAAEMPYKSAQMVLQGFKAGHLQESQRSLTLLADALIMAREHDQALSVLERVSQASKSPRDHMKLAQLAAEGQKWEQALSAVDRAIPSAEGGTLRQAQVLKGMILINLEKLAAARTVFEQAARDPSVKTTADQWLRFIDAEQARRDYLAAHES